MFADIRDFNAAGRRLLDALRCRISPESQEEYREYISVGESDLFIDMLAGELDIDQVPLVPAERDVVRDLLGFFELDPNDEYEARIYPRICAKDEVVARLNVVGEL